MNIAPMLQPFNRTPSSFPGATLQPLRTGARPGLALAAPGQPQHAADGFQLGSRGNPDSPQSVGASSSGRQLPNGVWWLDPASARHDVLYGGDGSFVLQRKRRGGPGLVPSPGMTGPALYAPPRARIAVQIAAAKYTISESR